MKPKPTKCFGLGFAIACLTVRRLVLIWIQPQ